ncbi:hypothetical protein Ancab_038721 [Ancistrocladus abbreviatus]
MSKLESLLLDKNRKMEHELTQLKVKLSEKTSLLQAAEAEVAELKVKIDEQKKLIQKLEDDILKGYSFKERRGSLFDDWDLSEPGSAEQSDECSLFLLQSHGQATIWLFKKHSNFVFRL